MVDLEFQYLALFEVLFLMVLTIIKFPRDKYVFSYKSATIITLLSVQSYTAFMIWWFQLYRMIFVFCVYLLVIGFVPYLAKESKYRRHLSVKDHFRDISDKLIVTSLVYLAASVYGLVKGQYEVSFLCAVTWWSSSSYHFFRESMYFNVDNIFAASLFIAFIYSLWISSGRADLEWYTNIGTIGLVLAGFLLIYCGNPATISFDNSYSPACCIRSGRALYDNVHSIWHLISGIGPTLSIWLFDYALEKELVDSYTLHFVMPTVAVMCGILINIIGNGFGVIPLD